MKAAIWRFIHRTASTPLFLFFLLFWPCERLGRIYLLARGSREAGRKSEECLRRIFPDRRVKHGPFTGMIYLPEASKGSRLLPKLLGSYESELAPVWDSLLAGPYTAIIDIGCAEGYYAIGMGRHFRGVPVYAFDTDAEGRMLCKKMASLNGIGDQVQVGGFCDSKSLGELPHGGRACVISDCEGYELHLFTHELIGQMSGSTFLIEVHDELDVKIDQALRQRFAATHDIIAIESIDDAKKVRTYDYPELQGLDPKTKLLMVGESRSTAMEWLYCAPKK